MKLRNKINNIKRNIKSKITTSRNRKNIIKNTKNTLKQQTKLFKIKQKDALKRKNIKNKLHAKRDQVKAQSAVIRGERVDTSNLRGSKLQQTKTFIKKKLSRKRNKPTLQLQEDLYSKNPAKRQQAATNYQKQLTEQRKDKNAARQRKLEFGKSAIEGGALIASMHALSKGEEDDE